MVWIQIPGFCYLIKSEQITSISCTQEYFEIVTNGGKTIQFAATADKGKELYEHVSDILIKQKKD